MNPQYLAAFDGSEQAEGRGSGKELRTVENRVSRIPYMHMTFAPSERRLDTAIFRALFASSARQARQFVIHGHVKVNGKKVCTLIVLLISVLFADAFLDDISRISFEPR